MKASTIISAINAMRAVDRMYCGTVSYSIDAKARAWNDLSFAAHALESELGALNINIESAAAVPGLAAGAGLPPVHAVAADSGETS